MTPTTAASARPATAAGRVSARVARFPRHEGLLTLPQVALALPRLLQVGGVMSTNRKSPDASGAAPGRVVVGVHGSRSSLRALRYAAEIALDRGWDLEIVTAWPDADDPLIHDVPGRYIDGARTRGRVPAAGPRHARSRWWRRTSRRSCSTRDPRRRSSPDAKAQTCWSWGRAA